MSETAAVLLVVALAGAGPDELCAPRAVMLEALAAHYRERPAGAGLSGPIMMEVLAAPDGATWSLLVTRPDGISCIVAAGQGWRAAPPVEERL